MDRARSRLSFPPQALEADRKPELSPGPSRPRGAQRAWLSPRPGAFDVTACISIAKKRLYDSAFP